MVQTIQGIHYKTNKPIVVKIKKELISEINHNATFSSNQIIAPGLVDLQINGFNGVDFNEENLDEQGVVDLTKKLWEQGVTSYYPTLITNSNKAIEKTLKVLISACEKNELIASSIAGIHLEGPFLSKEDGPRGAHPLEHIKAPDWELFSRWQKIAQGKIKMITLAPEWPTSVSFIKQCVLNGVVVAIGHTAANAEQIQNAVLAGARVATHLGNACHAMLPRHANYIWEQLALDSLWATFIADGFHLPTSVLKVFVKVKSNQCVLVSDATRFAGLPFGTYQSHIGGTIELSSSGKLFIKDQPNMLAGSAQSLLWCVNHIVSSKITTLANAIDMASVKVAELMKVDLYGTLNSNTAADFIVFKREAQKITILETYKSGQLVYAKN